MITIHTIKGIRRFEKQGALTCGWCCIIKKLAILIIIINVIVKVKCLDLGSCEAIEE